MAYEVAELDKLHVNGDEWCSDCWPEYSVLGLLRVPPMSETNKREFQYLRQELGNLILSQILGRTLPCCWENEKQKEGSRACTKKPFAISKRR